MVNIGKEVEKLETSYIAGGNVSQMSINNEMTVKLDFKK